MLKAGLSVSAICRNMCAANTPSIPNDWGVGGVFPVSRNMQRQNEQLKKLLMVVRQGPVGLVFLFAAHLKVQVDLLLRGALHLHSPCICFVKAPFASALD